MHRDAASPSWTSTPARSSTAIPSASGSRDATCRPTTTESPIRKAHRTRRVRPPVSRPEIAGNDEGHAPPCQAPPQTPQPQTARECKVKWWWGRSCECPHVRAACGTPPRGPRTASPGCLPHASLRPSPGAWGRWQNVRPHPNLGAHQEAPGPRMGLRPPWTQGRLRSTVPGLSRRLRRQGPSPPRPPWPSRRVCSRLAAERGHQAAVVPPVGRHRKKPKLPFPRAWHLRAPATRAVGPDDVRHEGCVLEFGIWRFCHR